MPVAELGWQPFAHSRRAFWDIVGHQKNQGERNLWTG
jgi:hypothetical protein